MPGSISHFSVSIEIGQASGLFLSSCKESCSLGSAPGMICNFHHCKEYRADLSFGRLYDRLFVMLFRLPVDQDGSEIDIFPGTKWNILEYCSDPDLFLTFSVT